MNILVLLGGESTEHEISLMSASSVVRNLKSAHKVFAAFISKQGEWRLLDESCVEACKNGTDFSPSLAQNSKTSAKLFLSPHDGFYLDTGTGKPEKLPVDFVFPVLHGANGEDGTVQGLLELMNVPYAGCGVFASACAMDKEKAKIIWQHAGLPVVPWVCIRHGELGNIKAILDKAVKELGLPLFVKPCSSGSTVGVSKAKDASALEKAVHDAFSFDSKVLIEKCIDAREIECSVTGDSVFGCGEKADSPGVSTLRVLTPRVFTPGELAPSHEFYDYDAKYIDPDGAKILIPAPISGDEAKAITEMAERAYRALDCRGLSRVDFFIDKLSIDKSSAKIYINELNTMPGFTQISMFPKLCDFDGLHYTEMLENLIEQGYNRWASR